mgnify:CR=1 FL=1
MSSELVKKVELLEHTLRVLGEENSQLAERAEDSLLLGLISESTQAAATDHEVLENASEKISILKSLPFVTCVKLVGGKVEQLCSYASFSSAEEHKCTLSFPEETLLKVSLKPCVVKTDEDFHVGF